MKTSELKNSKYMKKEDCGDDGILVTIAALKQENVAPDNKPAELKWILYFQGDFKPLVINSTNTKLIEKALDSDETDDWIGKQIVLFNDEGVEYMGDIVGGVRCDVTRTRKYHAKANTKQVVKGGGGKHFDDMADDVPF